MKSLEALKNIRREAGVPYFSTLYDIDMWKEDFETIKQDLEVLEIIRKKRVDVAELVGCLIYFDNDEDVLEDYNSIRSIERQLTMEELLKLKQWLEVNE